MGNAEDWTIPTDVHDFLGQAKRRREIDARDPGEPFARPEIGPGIRAEAVDVSNWNDQLATYNGTYASAPGALNAPTTNQAFIGETLMDPEFGGIQNAWPLVPGTTISYRRAFTRAPGDAATITWGAWVKTDSTPVVVPENDTRKPWISAQELNNPNVPLSEYAQKVPSGLSGSGTPLLAPMPTDGSRDASGGIEEYAYYYFAENSDYYVWYIWTAGVYRITIETEHKTNGTSLYYYALRAGDRVFDRHPEVRPEIATLDGSTVYNYEFPHYQHFQTEVVTVTQAYLDSEANNYQFPIRVNGWHSESDDQIKDFFNWRLIVTRIGDV